MKRYGWFMATSAMLVALSATIYGIHYLKFGDFHHIAIYLLGDIAFVPLEVLLVVVVLERLLARHERRHLMEKMNMLIGTFFSEVGTELLGRLTPSVKDEAEVRSRIAVEAGWRPQDYKKAVEFAESFAYRVDAGEMDLAALRDWLAGKRDFVVLLLANPNLLEHDRFTGLLSAVHHLHEELAARDSLENLPKSDLNHLAGDIRRVYAQLTTEWLHYCRHIQTAYPYIFSIVTRTHPLREAPSPVVA